MNVTNLPGTISNNQQNIIYTPFNMVHSINEGDYLLEIKYGTNQQRRKTELKDINTGAILNTKYFHANYEKLITANHTYEINYINSPTGLCVIYVKDNGVEKMYYVYSDHLGSILKVTDHNGTTYEQNFDAWGRMRNPSDWDNSNIPSPPEWLFRGFTGHEHMGEFAMINMNGRMYDPILGSMLSPDNYVADASSTISFNRYAYCFGNPLTFIDQDGNMPAAAAIIMAIGAYVGGASANQGELNPGKWNYKAPSTYFGIAIGAAMGYVGGYYMSAGGALGWQFRAVLPGITAYWGGSNADWNFSWTTPAGGGGSFGNSYSGSIDWSAVNNSRDESNNSQYAFDVGQSFYDIYGGSNFNNGSIASTDPNATSNGTWGTLTIVSDTYNETGVDAGHAWLELSPKGSKDYFTMSIWGNQGNQEFFINREKNLGINKEAWRTRTISGSEFQLLLYYASNSDISNWTPFNTCAGFSSKVWNFTTGESLISKEWNGFTTPRRLQQSINVWNYIYPIR